MKVFVSSTVYDLLDVRAEVKELFTEMGAIPIMSDESLSEFQVVPKVNSIETCLVNVDAADQFIIVLDRRYGPRLGSLGFDDVSATHLEYKRAAARNLPIHFFVRDRLEADFSVWKRNRNKTSPDLAWVQDPKDYGLFELLAEHAKLEKKAPRSNWYTTFTNSFGLKAILRKRFDATMLEEHLVREINANRFPLLIVENECSYEQLGGDSILRMRISVTNVGGAPAFDLRMEWEDRKSEKDKGPTLLAPGQSVELQTFVGVGGRHTGCESILACSFHSALGVKILERHRIGGKILPGNIIWSGANRLEQRLSRSKGINIAIEDSDGPTD